MKSTIPKEPVSISFQITLLHALDQYCISHDSDRSQITNRAVRRFLAAEKGDNPATWEEEYNNGK